MPKEEAEADCRCGGLSVPDPRLPSPLKPGSAHTKTWAHSCSLWPRAGHFPPLRLRKGQPQVAASHGGAVGAEVLNAAPGTEPGPHARRDSTGQRSPMGPVLWAPALGGSLEKLRDIG